MSVNSPSKRRSAFTLNLDIRKEATIRGSEGHHFVYDRMQGMTNGVIYNTALEMHGLVRRYQLVESANVFRALFTRIQLIQKKKVRHADEPAASVIEIKVWAGKVQL
jgi:hypothetical protein